MDSTIVIAGLAALFLLSGKKASTPPSGIIEVPPPNLPPNNPNGPGGEEPDGPYVFVPGVPEPQQPQQPQQPDQPPPDAPWPAIFRPDYPTAGRFYKVVSGDTFLGKSIAFKVLAGVMYKAARAAGDSHEVALDKASAFANAQNRVAYTRAIEGDAWNDHNYGTFGYGPSAMPNPTTRRAIRLLPQNADNAARLAAGQRPIRSVLLSTPNNAGQGTGVKAPGAPGGHLEVLWLPDVDGAAAYATGQVVVDRSGPPAWVTSLGVDDRSGAPAGTKWGA